MAASVRNTAIKRIQGDVREMMTNPSDQYSAAPLETNMFDWHFTLRGPRDTEFEGGIYHGRIILPSDYPFKPPNIMLLTPNGRFEVKKKICLSISAHHPEEWQPAWGVRLILEALISFMPTKGEGAIGALDFPADERKRLAKLSVDYKCDTCGRVADLLPELEETEGEAKPSKYADQIAQLHMHSMESAPKGSASQDTKEASGASDDDSSKEEQNAAAALENVKPAAAQPREGEEKKPNPAENVQSQTENASTTENSRSTATSGSDSAAVPTTEPPTAAEARGAQAISDDHQNLPDPVAVPNAHQVRESDNIDAFLHYLTIGIVVALFALIYKKLLQMHGVLQ